MYGSTDAKSVKIDDKISSPALKSSIAVHVLVYPGNKAATSNVLQTPVRAHVTGITQSSFPMIYRPVHGFIYLASVLVCSTSAP